MNEWDKQYRVEVQGEAVWYAPNDVEIIKDCEPGSPRLTLPGATIHDVPEDIVNEVMGHAEENTGTPADVVDIVERAVTYGNPELDSSSEHAAEGSTLEIGGEESVDLSTAIDNFEAEPSSSSMPDPISNFETEPVTVMEEIEESETEYTALAERMSESIGGSYTGSWTSPEPEPEVQPGMTPGMSEYPEEAPPTSAPGEVDVKEVDYDSVLASDLYDRVADKIHEARKEWGPEIDQIVLGVPQYRTLTAWSIFEHGCPLEQGMPVDEIIVVPGPMVHVVLPARRMLMDDIHDDDDDDE